MLKKMLLAAVQFVTMGHIIHCGFNQGGKETENRMATFC
jgi:hypothetical protein